MVDAGRVTADVVPDALKLGAEGEERLPILHAAAVILALSLGVWGVIGAGLNWLVG
jgi:hypothetical protein